MKWSEERKRLKEQVRNLASQVDQIAVANGKLMDENWKLREQARQAGAKLEETNKDYRYALARDAEIQRKLIEKLASTE